MSVQTKVVLEPAAQAFADATSKPPLCTSWSAGARKVLDDVQAGPWRSAVDEAWITVPVDVGDARVRVLKPPDADGCSPRSSMCTAGDGCSATRALTIGSCASWPSARRGGRVRRIRPTRRRPSPRGHRAGIRHRAMERP